MKKGKNNTNNSNINHCLDVKQYGRALSSLRFVKQRWRTFLQQLWICGAYLCSGSLNA